MVFPESLTTIGSNAFSGCTKLANVEFPENLEKISSYAFQECTSLTSIHFPLKTNFINEESFSFCTALESITFEDGENFQECGLSKRAFEGCTSLTSVVLSAERYVSVAGGAFWGCTSLTEFKLAGDSSHCVVYDGCLYKDIVLSFEEGPKKQLAACPAGKTNVEFLPGVTYIGGSAFAGCTKLTSVEIPDTVTDIYWDAFDCCEALTKAVLPKNLNRITSYSFRSTGITEIEIPETVDNIESFAFYGCKGLKTVTIPGKAEAVGSQAFEACTSLESVYLQEGVKRIDSQAFLNCTGLKTLAIPESVFLIEHDAIGNTTGNESTATLTIYGKAGSEAETYAKNQRINFSTEQPPQPPSGDKPEEPDEEIFDISDPAFTVTLDVEEFDYDGKEKEPNVTVKKGDTLLTPGADFTIDYVDNVKPGTAKVIVEGRRKYKGTVNKEFTIKGIDISGTSFTVTLSESKYTYDGTAKQPAVTVTKGTEKLRGTDFTVKYENNINPGTAKAIVTGAGIYTGTVTKEFTIETAPDSPDTPSQEKKSTNLTCKKTFAKKYGDKSFSLQATAAKGVKITYKSSDKKVAEVDKKGKVTIKGTGIATITVTAAATGYETKTLKATVKVSPSKGSAPSLKVLKGRKLKVSWKKDKRATGYQIQYCTSKAFKKGVKTIPISKNKTVTKTISKLANGKRYYVRVRAYKSVKVNKKTQKLYGSWSNVKRSGKIKK